MIRFNPSLIGSLDAKSSAASSGDRGIAQASQSTTRCDTASMQRPSFSEFSISTSISGDAAVVGGAPPNKAVTATRRAKNRTTFANNDLTDDLIEKSMRRSGPSNNEKDGHDEEGKTKLAMRPAVDALLQSFNGPCNVWQGVKGESEGDEEFGYNDDYVDGDEREAEGMDDDMGDVTSSFFLHRMLEKNKRQDGGMLDVEKLGRSMLSGSEIGVAAGKGPSTAKHGQQALGASSSRLLGGSSLFRDNNSPSKHQSQSSVSQKQLDASALLASKQATVKSGEGKMRGTAPDDSGAGDSCGGTPPSNRKESTLSFSLKSAVDLGNSSSGREPLTLSGSLEGKLVDGSWPPTATPSKEENRSPGRKPIDTMQDKQTTKSTTTARPMPQLPKSKRCQASTLPIPSQQCSTICWVPKQCSKPKKQSSNKKRDEEAVTTDEEIEGSTSPDQFFGSINLDLPPPSLLQHEPSPGFQRAVVVPQAYRGDHTDLYDFSLLSPPPPPPPPPPAKRIPVLGSPPLCAGDEDDLEIDSGDEEFAMVSPQHTALPSEVPYSQRVTAIRCPQPPTAETSPQRSGDGAPPAYRRQLQQPTSASISPSSASGEGDGHRSSRAQSPSSKRFTGIRSSPQQQSPQVVSSPHPPNSVSVLSPGDLEILMLPPADIAMRPQSPRKGASTMPLGTTSIPVSRSPKSRSPQVSPSSKGAGQVRVKLTIVR